MWIKKIGKNDLGVVLGPLRSVSGVIRAENVSDPSQVTFSTV